MTCTYVDELQEETHRCGSVGKKLQGVWVYGRSAWPAPGRTCMCDGVWGDPGVRGDALKCGGRGTREDQ